MPKVSVIIPNYNHAPYLKQRIDSVLNQTYQDFEVILLDDCSSDNSKEIIKLYANHTKFSHFVFNQINSGNTFKQWQKGFDLAQGELIWIAESDDWCEPTLLENLIQGFEKEECVISYCQSFIIKENTIIWKSDYNTLGSFINGNTFVKEYMVFGNTIFNASMVLFKRNVLKSISIDYQQFSFCGDWLFWIELAKQGSVYTTGKVLNYFRKHGNDISGKAYSAGINFFEEIKILHSLQKDLLIDEKEFLKALKSKYLNFKSVEANLSLEKRIEIRKKFFINKKTIKYLKSRDFLTLKRLYHYLKRTLWMVFL